METLHQKIADWRRQVGITYLFVKKADDIRALCSYAILLKDLRTHFNLIRFVIESSNYNKSIEVEQFQPLINLYRQSLEATEPHTSKEGEIIFLDTLLEKAMREQIGDILPIYAKEKENVLNSMRDLMVIMSKASDAGWIEQTLLN